VQIEDGGWSIQGDGGAATKASFNLLGGFVEFDFDVSSANTGVIPNIYTVSPDGIGGGFTSDSYCDMGENDKPDCLEVLARVQWRMRRCYYAAYCFWNR